MKTVTQKIFYYCQSKEFIREEISTLEDEVGDGMAGDGENIEILN